MGYASRMSTMLPSRSLRETPSGLLVPQEAYDDLVKAEARRLVEAQEAPQSGSLFSRFGWNMLLYGAREKTRGTPAMDILYAAAERSFVDRILIRARVNQMKLVWQPAMTGKAIGYRVVHDRADDKDFDSNTPEIRRQCEEAQKLLGDPTPLKHLHVYPHNVRIHDSLKDAVARLTKAELIIDRKVMRRYKRADGKGYAAWHWLPGETIRNVDEFAREWAQKNEKTGKLTAQTMTRASYATGYDLQRCSHVQIIDGEFVAAFTPEEVSVHVAHPSDRLNAWGYGVSPLEDSLDVTALLVKAWLYNKDLFDPEFPESILTVAGGYDQEGLLAFKQQVLSEMQGRPNKRMPVISTAPTAQAAESLKMSVLKLRDTPKDMLFDTLCRFLILFKCASYGVSPSTIGFSADTGSGSSLFGQGPTEAQLDLAKEHGLRPSLNDFCVWLTDSLVKPSWPELRVVVQGLEKEDEKATVEIRGQRASKWITRNEARMEEGLEAIGDMEDLSSPWNMPADGPLAGQIAQLQMAQQSAMGLQQGQDEGGWGDEEDPGDQGAPAGEPVAKARRETRVLRIKVL